MYNISLARNPDLMKMKQRVYNKIKLTRMAHTHMIQSKYMGTKILQPIQKTPILAHGTGNEIWQIFVIIVKPSLLVFWKHLIPESLI